MIIYKPFIMEIFLSCFVTLILFVHILLLTQLLFCRTPLFPSRRLPWYHWFFRREPNFLLLSLRSELFVRFSPLQGPYQARYSLVGVLPGGVCTFYVHGEGCHISHWRTWIVALSLRIVLLGSRAGRLVPGFFPRNHF